MCQYIYASRQRIVHSRAVCGWRLIPRKNAHDDFLAVGEGFVEITNDHVSIVTNMAIPADRIDEAAAEEARQRGIERLREEISSEEVATVNASLAAH